MKQKPTQMSVIAQALLQGDTLNLSKAYKITKSKCKCGCMKLSTRISDYFEPMGLIFTKEKGNDNYMNYTLNVKKSTKQSLKTLKQIAYDNN